MADEVIHRIDSVADPSRLPYTVCVLLENLVRRAGTEHVTEEAVRALANRGRIVVCGASSGGRVELDLIDLFARQIEVIGSSDGSRRELVELFRLLAESRVAPPVISAVLPLERAADAQALLASADHFGRVLLDPRQTGDSPRTPRV